MIFTKKHLSGPSVYAKLKKKHLINWKFGELSGNLKVSISDFEDAELQREFNERLEPMRIDDWSDSHRFLL